MSSPVDLATIDEPWPPRTVAVLDDYDLRVVHTRGEFTRLSHPRTDEVFLVPSGSLTVRMDDDVPLGPGHLHAIPTGTPHQPYSRRRTTAPRRAKRQGEHRRHPGQLTAERRLIEP